MKRNNHAEYLNEGFEYVEGYEKALNELPGQRQCLAL